MLYVKILYSKTGFPFPERVHIFFESGNISYLETTLLKRMI